MYKKNSHFLLPLSWLNSLMRLLVLGLFFFSSLVLAEAFEEGEHYKLVPKPDQSSPLGQKIEVAEFFWYGCPHCFKLEPRIHKWSQNLADDVVFTQTPALFGKLWILHGAVYYTGKALGLGEDFHQALFDEIQVKKNRLETEEKVLAFFQRFGKTPQQVSSTMNSIVVRQQLDKANQRAKSYGLQGVPTTVIDGRYETSPAITGDFSVYFRVMNYLIEKVRNERKLTKAS
ncbi:thiol:disulfide interchange protein DsbA/DsbL [Pelagibaculum spongiae]|nr:thiol:disulfide interchange protein DsbA/DsbL [Pelagibaculum spongiae]